MPGHSPLFHVIILACNRIQLFHAVYDSVVKYGPKGRTSLQIWLDKPITDQDEHYNALLNFTRQLDTEPWVHTITFARHVGTRAMWLTAMSLREPHLILEDDVVLLPSAYEYYVWSLQIMRENAYILGSSFHAQTLIPVIGVSRHLHVNLSHTFRLVGSHGFVLSPYARRDFLRMYRTRQPCELNLKNLVTTRWYQGFQKTGMGEERMWTQEMIAFAVKYNLTTLYPPSFSPASIHCASGHAVDSIARKCLDLKGLRRYKFNGAPTLHIGWDGRVGIDTYRVRNTCQDKKYHNLTLYNGVWRSYDELPSVDELRDAIAQSIKFGRR